MNSKPIKIPGPDSPAHRASHLQTGTPVTRAVIPANQLTRPRPFAHSMLRPVLPRCPQRESVGQALLQPAAEAVERPCAYTAASAVLLLEMSRQFPSRGRRASRRTTSLTAPYSFASTALSFWPLSRKYDHESPRRPPHTTCKPSPGTMPKAGCGAS